jgi:DNA-binding transcriptional regulator YdaS (Cro superfamily)
MDDASASLEKAKALAGGPSGLAFKLGDITPQAISQWKRVPADRAIQVEALTGISRHELRPDVFGAGEQAAS